MIKPAVTVKDGSTKLTEGKDYKLTFDKSVYVGIKEIIVEGIGKYAGIYRKQFIIKPAKNKVSEISLSSGGNVTVSWEKDYSGTGYELVCSRKADFSDSRSLSFEYVTNGKDNNTTTLRNVFKTGETLYVKVRSFYTRDGEMNSTRYGNFSSVASIKNTSDISTFKASVPVASYTIGWGDPVVTVKNGSSKLKEGKDYTVAYKNTDRIGIATAVITGKGFYKGTLKKTYVVKPYTPFFITGKLKAIPHDPRLTPLHVICRVKPA